MQNADVWDVQQFIYSTRPDPMRTWYVITYFVNYVINHMVGKQPSQPDSYLVLGVLQPEIVIVLIVIRVRIRNAVTLFDFWLTVNT